MIKYTMTVGEMDASFELESMEQLFAVMNYNKTKVDGTATVDGKRPPKPGLANHSYWFSPSKGKWYSAETRKQVKCWFEWNDNMGSDISTDNLPDDLIK